MDTTAKPKEGRNRGYIIILSITRMTPLSGDDATNNIVGWTVQIQGAIRLMHGFLNAAIHPEPDLKPPQPRASFPAL